MKIKLNEKGYMLVEIVLATVLAFSIAYYLLNLTYKFKDTNEDLYQSIIYIQDKNMLTKNIMNDIDESNILQIVSCGGNCIEFTVEDGVKRLEVDKDNRKIVYGKYSGGLYVEGDKSYYSKVLDKSLVMKDMVVEVENNQFVSIVIPAYTIYDNTTDYGIKLFIRATGDSI